MRKFILFIVLVLLIPAAFSLNWNWAGISTLKNVFIELTDQFNGDVTGTYDDIQVNDDSHLHDAQNITAEQWVNESGDTMTGNLFMGGNNITNVSYLGVGVDEPGHNVDIVGDLLLTHVATDTDEHGLEIKVDAAGIGDVKGLDIIYTTGGIETGENEEAILINIDEFDASGGHVVGLEVISTEGLADIYGVEVGVLVNPLLQLSGVFMDMDSLSNDGVDHRAQFISVTSDVEFFVDDNDYLIIGHLIHFEEVEFILNTSASKNVKPTFEFSTGVGSWDVFTPADGTNGFENTGVVIWDRADVPSWATGAGGEYLVRITRTRNNLQVVPIEKLVQVSDVTEYIWNKEGDIRLRNVNATVFNGNVDCSWFTGNSSDLCTLTDTDTDTNLTEADVDSYVANNGYALQSGVDSLENNFTAENTTIWTNISNLETSGFVDTNESTRFNTLVGTDCVGSDKATGIDADGTISCSADLYNTYTNGSGINLTVNIFSHFDTSTQVSSDNSARTYIQDIFLDTFGHITSIVTATETVTDSDSNLTGADIVSHVGNWSSVKSDYYNITEIEVMNSSLRTDLADTNETTNVEALLVQNTTTVKVGDNISSNYVTDTPSQCSTDYYTTGFGPNNFSQMTCTYLIDTDSNLTGADIVSHVGNWSSVKSDYYNITEMEGMNSSIRNDLADTNTWWTIKPQDFINNSNTLELNWTSLNDTMDARDTDTDTNLTEFDVEQYIFDDGIHCGNLTGNTSDLCTLTDTDTHATSDDFSNFLNKTGGTMTDLLTINQSADEEGLQINGFDDKSNEWAKVNVDYQGYGGLYTSNQTIIAGRDSTSTERGFKFVWASSWADVVSVGGMDLLSWAINFKISDDKKFTFGSNNDFAMGYSDSEDSWRIVVGNVLTSDEAIIINDSGNVDFPLTLTSADWTNVTITESQISDLVHTTDTDTNLTEADVDSYIFDDGIHCGNLTGNTSDLCTLEDTDSDSNLTGADIVSHVGNWSADEGNYYTSAIMEGMNDSIRSDLADTNETDNVEALLVQNVSDAVTFFTLNLSGNLTWEDLYEFPAACPTDSYVTQIDDSITCTEVLDTDSNLTEFDVEQYIFDDGIHCGNLTENSSDLCTLVDTDTTIGNCSVANSCPDILYELELNTLTELNTQIIGATFYDVNNVVNNYFCRFLTGPDRIDCDIDVIEESELDTLSELNTQIADYNVCAMDYENQGSLNVSQNEVIKVGNAYVSSGGVYAHLSNAGWNNGSDWLIEQDGGLIQLTGTSFRFYTNIDGSFVDIIATSGENVGVNTTSSTETFQVVGTVDLDVNTVTCGYKFMMNIYGTAVLQDTGDVAATSMTALETEGKTYTCLDCITHAGIASTCSSDTTEWSMCEFQVEC